MAAEQRDRRDDWPSEMKRPEPDERAAEIARHQSCTCEHHQAGGLFERHFCAWCGAPWPCLVRRLADAHADCSNLSHAEASRIFEEARQMREERDAALDVLRRLNGHPTPVTPDGRCWICGGGLGHGPDGHHPTCAWTAMRALAPGGEGEGEGHELP